MIIIITKIHYREERIYISNEGSIDSIFDCQNILQYIISPAGLTYKVCFFISNIITLTLFEKHYSGQRG